MKDEEVITDHDLHRELLIQVVLKESHTATRIGQELIRRTRAKRLALQTLREARQDAGAQAHPETEEGPS